MKSLRMKLNDWNFEGSKASIPSIQIQSLLILVWMHIDLFQCNWIVHENWNAFLRVLFSVFPVFFFFGFSFFRFSFPGYIFQGAGTMESEELEIAYFFSANPKLKWFKYKMVKSIENFKHFQLNGECVCVCVCIVYWMVNGMHIVLFSTDWHSVHVNREWKAEAKRSPLQMF